MERDREDDDDDGTVCLDESFFVNRNYEIQTFTFGTHALHLYCLRSASTDYDLTGQLVWPGAVLLNNYLSMNSEILQGKSVIELGSGVGITGILCSKFCREVVLTDHNDEVLEIMKKNIELQESNPDSAGLIAEKLEWGNSNQMTEILKKYPRGFDLILGADIFILFLIILYSSLCFPSWIFIIYLFYLDNFISFQQSSIPLLFNTVEKLLHFQGDKCRFILAYVSRAKIMDSMVMNEAVKLGMKINEVSGTRSIISNYKGVIFEISLS